MILQWVRLHDTTSSYIRYGSVIKYGNVEHPSLIRGNVLNWKRDNLWKCIEFVDDKIVEHIVHFKTPVEPMIVLLSKFSSSAYSHYTQMYKEGICKWYNKVETDLHSKQPIPHVFFNVVRAISRTNTMSYLPNILDEWMSTNSYISEIVPIRSNEYLNPTIWSVLSNEEPGISGTDIDTVGILPVADYVHEMLTDAIDDVRNGVLEHTDLGRYLDTSFSVFKYHAYGSLSTKYNFRNSDVSPMSVESRSNKSINLETLIAPKISDIQGVNSSDVVVPQHSKEITSIVVSIQAATSVTDFRLLFDITRFSSGQYDPVSIDVYDRYTGSVVPIIPYISRYDESYRVGNSGYVDWTPAIGEAVCDYICTLNNNVDIHNRYELVQVTKTYNEDLIIQFGTRDKVWTETHYVDIIGCLMTTTDMGTIVGSTL